MAEFNPYAYQDWQSQGIREGLDSYEQEIKERREEQRRRAEDARLAQMDEMRQMQMLDMKTKQLEAFQVPADTGNNALDNTLMTASRQLVDSAASITAQVKSGEMDQEQAAQALATIKSQVPQLQTFKETLKSNLNTYVQGVADGTLSGAMIGDPMYSALLNKEGSDFGLVQGEDGQMMFSGTDANGEKISIPISGIGQMPKPIMKQPAPYETLKPEFMALAASNPTWDEEASQKAAIAYDNAIGGDKNAMLSMAVDHYGLTLDEAKELYMKPQQMVDGVMEENHLDQFLENKFVSDAESVWKAGRLEIREQELANEYKEAQIAKMTQEQNNRNGGGARLTSAQQQHQADINAYQGIGNLVNELGAAKPEDKKAILQQLAGDGLTVDYFEPTTKKEGGIWGWGAKDVDVPGGYSVQIKGQDEPILIKENDFESLWQLIANNALGQQQAMAIKNQYFSSPMQRTGSPLDRTSRGARKAAQNEKTKAAHAQARKEHWDELPAGEKVTLGDIAASAAGGIPYAGALAGAGKIGKAVSKVAKAVGSKASAGLQGAGGAISENLGSGTAANVAAGGLQGGAIGAAKGFAKGKAKDLAKKGLKAVMKSGLGMAGDVAGTAAKGIGIVGTAKAAYDTAKLYNKMQAQNMSEEEYANFRKTGSTTGSRRGKNSRGRRS